MAAWNVGPFDNDDAVDWCTGLENTRPHERATLVRSTLERATLVGSGLDPRAAAEAVAAAATVLQALTGEQTSDSPYAPRFLLGRGDIEAKPDVCALAVQALDAVAAYDSKWRLSWAGDVEADEVLAAVTELRTALAAAAHRTPMTT